MRYLLCFFISLNVYALEPGEKLTTRIIELIPTNFVIFNRGLIDDIAVGEHIQLQIEEQMFARGVCLQAKKNHSLWKVYRIHSPGVFELDLDFTMVSLKLSTVRPHHQYEKVDIPENVQKIFSAYQ